MPKLVASVLERKTVSQVSTYSTNERDRERERLARKLLDYGNEEKKMDGINFKEAILKELWAWKQ